MIRKPGRFWEALVNVVDRIDAAHGDLIFLVSVLRDTTNRVVWTISPPEPDPEDPNPDTRPQYSLQAIGIQYQQQRQRIVSLRGTSVAAILDRLLPEYFDKAVDYVQDIGTAANPATLLGMIKTVLDRHTVQGVLQNEVVTNQERNQLANAIEGLLEP